MQQQPELVGHEPMAAEAVGFYVKLEVLYPVLALPALSVKLVELLWGIWPGCDDETPVRSLLHRFGLVDDPTGMLPASGLVEILAEEGGLDIDFGDGDGERAHQLWDMRKGFIPMFGATRPKGTTMLTEDVAGPVERLADFVIDMRKLLDEYGYYDGVLFGHALAGNVACQTSLPVSTS